jgi:hypothetical protein
LLADQGRCFFAKISGPPELFAPLTGADRCDVVQWQEAGPDAARRKKLVML